MQVHETVNLTTSDYDDATKFALNDKIGYGLVVFHETDEIPDDIELEVYSQEKLVEAIKEEISYLNYKYYYNWEESERISLRLKYFKITKIE